MVSSDSDARIIVLVFDTGKIDNSFYGGVVFENIVSGKEIMENPRKSVFSHGDLFNREIYADISPFTIRDDICTIRRSERYGNVLYGVLIEDITKNVAIKIDKRLKDEFPAYVGMTSVDIKSSDSRKQFWKSLIRRYSIELETITIFGVEEQGFYIPEEEINKYGFRINYDGFEGYYYDETGYLFSTRQSSFIQSYQQTEIVDGVSDSDRGLMEMNLSLVKEVNLAGVMLWKAIEDISLAHIPHKNELFADFATVDYIFTSLYQASQGIERLLKIVIQLIMYTDDDTSKKDEYERHLYSHKHLAMVDFITTKTDFKQIRDCKNFISLLQEFYKSARYNRFRYSENDRVEIVMMQKLGSDITENDYDVKVKHRYGKLIGKTSQAIYALIEDLARELNIYVYELNYETNAPYVLHSHHGTDLYETLMRINHSKRELLWYLLKNTISPKLKEVASEFPPFEFDEIYNINELTKCLINGENSDVLYGFVDDKYDELAAENKSNWKARVDFINFITSPDASEIDDEE